MYERPLPLAPCPFLMGSKGFTLVELAVVLVILGALFTAVLKVESMVKNAKTKQLFNQYRELRTAILVYKDKYGYLPGDDPYAREHVGATYANAVATGGGNGRIDNAINGTYRNENSFLFEHLGRAGLIKGTYDGTPMSGHQPFSKTPMNHPFSTTESPFSSMVVFYYNAPSLNIVSHVIEIVSLPYDVAQAFDQTFDDGVWNTGKVRSYCEYTAAATATPVTGDGITYPVGNVYYIMVLFE